MLTLRQINDEIEKICFETEDGNEAEIPKQLDALQMKLEEKLENIGYVRVEQKAYIKRLKAEKQRIDKEIASVEARGKWLDWYCMHEMLRAGIRTFKGKFIKLSICKSPVSAEVEIHPDTKEPQWDEIDPRFVEQVVTHKVNKSDAIQHYKQTGEVPDGFIMIENREHLRIR